jgi:hypothetical protein
MPVASLRRAPRVFPAGTPFAPGALLLIGGLAAAVLLAGGARADLGLRADPSRALDGVYQLSWSRDGGVRIEESRRPDFAGSRIVYEGRDQAATLSGRADGVYYYRALPLDSGDSATAPGDTARRARGAGAEGESVPIVRVDVRHHPLGRAMAFFAVGLVVFASTVGLVIRGDAGTARPEPGADGGRSNE